MKKRMRVYTLVLGLLFVTLTGCSQNSLNKAEVASTASAVEATSNDSNESSNNLVVDLSGITIGASVMSLQHEFMINLVEGYNEFVKQTNCKVLITDGGDMVPEKQVTNVENYISKKVDGILCQCISVETMKDTLKRAMSEGIPVGIYPWDKSVGATTYFGYNEHEWGYRLGESASKWINEKLEGKAKVISVFTSLEEPSRERRDGWVDAVNEKCDQSKTTWITVEATSSEDAMTNVESALQAHPDTDVVLVYNDEMGIGAYEAIVQSGLSTEKMYLGSCDGTNTALDYVEKDTVYRCTVGNDRFVSEIGFYWLENMVKIIEGMKYDDPFPITTMAVTLENVKDYRSRKPEYKISQELIDHIKNK